MAIQYSGNVAIYSGATGSTTPATDLESFLVTNLVTAGWTNTKTGAFATLTFTGQPAASSTFTLDNSPNNQTYTFVASGPTGNQILIDSSLANTLQNVLNALNAGPGSGTKYGSSLVQPPNMTASVTSTVLTVTYKTAGSSGNGAATSTSGTINATWSGSLAGGKNFLSSVITPQGLQCACDIHTASGSFYNPGANLVFQPQNVLSTTLPSATIVSQVPPSNTNYKMIASKYQFLVLIPGSSASNSCMNGAGMGTPFITSNLQAPTIVSATNANPIVCNVPNHGFNNSDTVYIVGAVGNTAANGSWTITKIDANNFSIPTTGNGAYTANSAYVSDLTLGNSVNEAIWACGTGGGAPATFRNNAVVSNGGWTLVNTNGLTTDNSTARLQLLGNASIDNGYNAVVNWYDGSFALLEPFVLWGISNGAASKIIGQLWDATLLRDAVTLDQTASFDSPAHNWQAFGVGNNNSLLLATT